MKSYRIDMRTVYCKDSDNTVYTKEQLFFNSFSFTVSDSVSYIDGITEYTFKIMDTEECGTIYGTVKTTDYQNWFFDEKTERILFRYKVI